MNKNQHLVSPKKYVSSFLYGTWYENGSDTCKSMLNHKLPWYYYLIKSVYHDTVLFYFFLVF